MKMRKSIFTILPVLCLSCSTVENTPETAANAPVMFRHSGLEEGDQVCIVMDYRDGSRATDTYTAGQETSLDGGGLRFKALEGATFLAYSPVTGELSEDELRFSASSDQSVSPDGSDLKTAYAALHKAKFTPVSLSFCHRFSELEIIVRDVVITKVIFPGVCLQAQWNMSDNSITLAPDGTVEDLTMFREENCFRAVVPAQIIPQGREILLYDETDKVYTFSIEEELRLTEGRRLSLTIGKRFSDGGLESIECTIDGPWHGESGISSWI